MYYWEVVKRKNICVNVFEMVYKVMKVENNIFVIEMLKGIYMMLYCIIVIGYYDYLNYMNVFGEDLLKVFYYFKEGYLYFDKDVVVIGGKNLSVDVVFEFVKFGVYVIVLYRGKEYLLSIKLWILFEFELFVRNGIICMEFGVSVEKIIEGEVVFCFGEKKFIIIKNDFVFVMIGYYFDYEFFEKMGVEIDKEIGCLFFNEEMMEMNVKGIFIVGVIVVGNNVNEIFIENGRFYGGYIVVEIVKRENY